MSEYRFRTEPFAHQRRAFDEAKDRSYYALLMEQGTGKSKVICDVVAYKFGLGQINAAVIVAPKTVTLTWVHEQLVTHLPVNVLKNATIVLWNSAENKKTQKQRASLFAPDPLSLKILVVNIDAFATKKGMDFVAKFCNAHDTLLAVDESSLIKNPKAERTKSLHKLKRVTKARMIASGTPITQSPLDLWAQLTFLSDEVLNNISYWGFRNRYAITRKRYVAGGHSFDEIIGYQKLEELKAIVEKNGILVKKADCLDLPEKIYQTMHCELGPEQKRLYDTLRDKAVVELKEAEQAGSISTPLILTKLLRLRQILTGHVVLDGELEPRDIEGVLPRLEILKELSTQLAAEKLIIWSSFRPSIARLARELEELHGPGKVVQLHGGIDTKDRQPILDAFQQGEATRLIANPSTGRFGLTLTSSAYMVYHDHDWSLEQRLQSEDRIHRIGQARNCTYINLVCPGTVDEHIIRALKRKENLAECISKDNWQDMFAPAQPTQQSLDLDIGDALGLELANTLGAFYQ